MEVSMRRNLPSDIKHIAEHRARLAGDVERLGALIAAAQKQLEQKRALIEQCDWRLRQWNQRLDPTRIRSQRTRTRSKRGDVKRTALGVLRDAYPRSLTTVALGNRVEEILGIAFEFDTDRVDWRNKCIGNRLREAAQRGEIERLHSPSPATQMGEWRWKPQHTRSLSDLEAQAEAVGLTATPSVTKNPSPTTTTTTRRRHHAR
jgi:hypothetical protein